MNKKDRSKKGIKAVVDTSVIVSSLLGSPSAAPAKVLRAMLEGAFQAYTSKQALEELYNTLLSEKIAELLGGKIEIAALTYILVNSKAKIVKPRKRIKICRDPDDDKYLEIAYQAKADYIVTLDKDLLDLRDKNKQAEINGHKAKILTPKEFLQTLKLGQKT